MTDLITEKLEANVIPWRKPWGDQGMPKNLVSKKEYRGINSFLLSCVRTSSSYFLTMKQANELGGSVKAGSKSLPVVYFKWLEGEDKTTGKPDVFPMLRYYRVFSADDITGIQVPKEECARDFNPIEACEKIVSGMPKCPPIDWVGGRAYYRPSTDAITLPPKALFTSEQGYYATLFHELTHSTGHISRLNRHKEEGADCEFGSTTYAKEELIAEMGAAFLCGHTGIENVPVENATAYIASWLKALKNDKRLVVTAAAQAQKAADFILDRPAFKK